MQKKLSLVALLMALVMPAIALANAVDATMIPDGTYTVKVEKLVDAKHIQVTMDGGVETTLTSGRDTVDFGKIKPGDQVKLSVIKGAVMVYMDLTSH